MSTFSTLLAQVEALYVGYFERAGDPAGTQYWENQIETGTYSLSQAAASFSVQLESQADYPFLASGPSGTNITVTSTNGWSLSVDSNVYNFINSVYMDLFNRSILADSTAAGLAYWSAQLKANAGNPVAIGNFIINVISGAATGGTDDQSLQAKVQVATYITTYVSSNGLTWTTALQNEVKTLIAATTNASSGAGSVATEETAWQTFITTSAPTTFTLTTGLDTITSTSSSLSGVAGPAATGNDQIYGTLDGSSATPTTLLGFDVITPGGTGNSLILVDGGGGSADFLPTGLTVSNVQSITLNGTDAGALSASKTFNVSSFTGLTSLTVNTGGAGGDDIIAAATTSVTDTTSNTDGVLITGGLNITVADSGTGKVTVGGGTTATDPAGTISVTYTNVGANEITAYGGTAVTITETGATTGAGTITVGGAGIAPTGAVVVNATTGAANADTIGAINVTGGTTVTITEAAGDAAVTGTSVAMGSVVVTGTTATTSVTVTQAAAATGTTAVTQVTGVVNVGGTPAAPGTNAVTAVAGVSPVNAITGLVGASDNTVNIADSVATASTAATAAGVSGGTIASVSLTNFASANISSPALTSLTLGGTGGDVNLYEGGVLGAINTTLTLNVNNLSGTTITDNSAQYTTLDVVTGATNSTLTSFTDASLKTLAVSGSSVLTVTDATSATSISVSGAAGYTGSVTDTTTTFNAAGSTGTDVITIGTDATKAITGSGTASDEIIANAAGGIFTAAKTGAEVTGFDILGITASTTGTTNASVFGSSIDQIAVTASVTTASMLTNVNTDAAISFAGAATDSTAALIVQYVDVTGASDNVTVTLAGASGSTYASGSAQTVSALTLEDANSVGIGTVNFVDNNPAFDYNGDTIAALTDTVLSTLNFSGAGGLQITGFTDDTATSLTIGNTGTNATGLTVTMTDDTLGGVTFTGTGTTILNLTDTVAGTLALTNSGTGSVKVALGTLDAVHLDLTGAMNVSVTDNNIASITLAASQTVSLTDGKTTGITVSGAADNSHVTLSLGAAAFGDTNTVTLGNANNSITDATTAGAVNITVGTGSNLINISTGSASTYSATVTEGTHTSAGPDEVHVGTVVAPTATPNTVISGAAAGDLIQFSDNGTTVYQLTSAQLATAAGESSLGNAITYADSLITSVHTADAFVYGGNTYVIESVAGATTLATGDALIEITGTHTLSSTVTANVFSLAS